MAAPSEGGGVRRCYTAMAIAGKLSRCGPRPPRSLHQLRHRWGRSRVAQRSAAEPRPARPYDECVERRRVRYDPFAQHGDRLAYQPRHQPLDDRRFAEIRPPTESPRPWRAATVVVE